ncbi:MAG: serine hydrolase domain-containing protein [Actinomycetota bacterium]
MTSEPQGTWDPRFAEVADELARNLSERGEVGASLHVVVDGEVVADLWGGSRTAPAPPDGDPGAATAEPEPWEPDTAVVVYSCTKGATALAAHLLIDRGELDLDAPVGDYWPEFATNGKDAATVRMMLNHSVGVPALRERLPDGACTDWDLMCERLAAEEPWWEPGTRNGYHMLTFGWTVGELVRRVSGRSLGRFFAEEVAGPLGADVWIGLPDAEAHRVAPVLQPIPDRRNLSRFTRVLLDDKGSLQRLAWLNTGGFDPNDPAVRRAEIGGGGGIATARGLARMYRPLAADGGDLVSAAAVARMGDVSVATGCDATLLLPTRFGLGFMKSMDNRRRPAGERDSAVLSSAAFGHVGAGGSIGFADPAAGLSFGYVMNQMGNGILLNERGQALVDATYRALGHTDDSTGTWIR